MIIGQVLTSNSADPGITYYSPWFPKQGNSATFAVDIIAVGDLDEMTIQAQTKKAEDDDNEGGGTPSVTSVGGAVTVVGTTGNNPATWQAGNNIDGSGFKDLVRFQYVVKQAASPTHLCFVHLRVLNPSWLTD